MTHDKRQLISKVLRGSMIAALAPGLAACDRPPSGDSIGGSFDRSVENVRQDLNKTENNAGRMETVPDKAGGTFTEAGRDVKNIALAARVKAALIGTRALDSSKIDVGATTDGVVTLTGNAEDATKRDLAERLTLSVEGVTAVRNDIAIARGS
jgi:osmotically-inducible protein OsmY